MIKWLIFQCKIRQFFEKRHGWSVQKILSEIKMNKQIVNNDFDPDIDIDQTDFLY
jgi:HD superfamily phosphohydrolase